jgi:transcriptional regulator with XRE-family HTH domain
MQSIGERLEEARKRKGLSIREASEATKIRSDYLHKFESNQFDINLPEIYVRGFLRTYANFLKAPADKILNDYNGLGLGDNKGRQINREVYGRMDLTVGSKMDKEPKEAGAQAAVASEEVATNADAGPRNPATFVPPRQASGRSPLDRDLILKGGILVLGLVIVVMLGVWLFTGRSKPATTTTTTTSSADAIWVKPLTGEPVLSLKASAPVTVTVTLKNDRTILYQGTIPRGDRRDIPRRGALYVTADPYQNLVFEIGGTPYNMPGAAADIRAP